jgi:hypothetical protein
MQASKTKRETVRLPLNRGVVFLRARGIPSIACALVDLSETGCRCQIPTTALDDATANRWLTHLEPGRKLSADISAPPMLSGVHLDIEVKHVQRNESVVEVGLFFTQVEDDEKTLIKNALLAFAAKKLTTTTLVNLETTQSSSSAQDSTHTNTLRDSNSASGVHQPVNGSASKAVVKNGFASPEVPEMPTRIATVLHGKHTDPYRGKRLGEILIVLGAISESQLAAACQATKSSGGKLGRHLLRTGAISPMDLCSAISLQSGMAMIDLKDVTVPPELRGIFTYLTLLKHEFVPFQSDAETISIAAAAPLSQRTISELEQRCGKKVKQVLAEDDVILKLLYKMQPKEARRMRKHTRYKVSLPIEFRAFNQHSSTPGDEVFYGKTIDISEDGLLVAAAEDLQRRGTCLSFSFSLPPDQVKGLCSVRHMTAKGSPFSEYPIVLGMQFASMTPDQRSILKQICIHVGMWNMKDRRARTV